MAILATLLELPTVEIAYHVEISLNNIRAWVSNVKNHNINLRVF